MRDSKVLLCTGGIGSGKSCIARAFSEFGIPSYDTDSAAKRLYDTDSLLLGEIASIVGKDVVSDGKLCRPLLAARIFSDNSLLSEVEAAVHPAVMRDFEKWKESVDAAFVLIESAIILEKPSLRKVADYVLTVSVPEDIRVARVMYRDGIPETAVRKRMASQWTDSQREACADFVLTPDDSHKMIPEILNIIETISNRVLNPGLEDSKEIQHYGKNRS